VEVLRKVGIVLLVLLLVLLVAAVLVYRNGVHPQLVLWIIKSTWDRTQDLEARFEGDTEVLGLQVSGAGRLRFKKPGLYDLDLNTVRVIAGPKCLWAIVPSLQTGVRVTAEGMTPAQVMSAIVSGWQERDPARWVDEAVAAPAEVKLWAPQVVEGQRCWLLEWPSRTGERIGGRLYVGQVSRAPVQFCQMDSGGQITHTYKITNFRRNTGLKPEDFEYKPMAGYSVIDYHYDPKDPVGLQHLIESGGKQLGGLRDQLKQALPPEAADWLRSKGL
jgi:outer membrane lipoprotein-sorting protein